MYKYFQKYYNKFSSIASSLKHLGALSYSYSQSGEDLIVKRVLGRLNLYNKRYIDIGCNHPVKLNNTYLLYKSNYQGILLDANPFLAKTIRKWRKKDHFINSGIDGTTSDSMIFYILSNSSLSTFDKSMVEKIISGSDIKIIKEQKVPVMGINDFLKNNFTSETAFISIDVEGADTRILQNWDFNNFRPVVFCVETISHLAENKIQQKAKEIFKIFERENYLAFADTYINTIFVDKDMWYNRLQSQTK